jgi:hypothetical protein
LQNITKSEDKTHFHYGRKNHILDGWREQSAQQPEENP